MILIFSHSRITVPDRSTADLPFMISEAPHPEFQGDILRRTLSSARRAIHDADGRMQDTDSFEPVKL